MRGPDLVVIIISGLLLCAASSAQKVQFAPADKSVVLERMKTIPESNQERADRLRDLFIDAGCRGNSLTEQTVEGAETPNIMCRLGRNDGEMIIVGAHYERASSAGSLDNWSGASLLPVLYQSLREKKRSHSFLFVAFADNGTHPTGAESFIRSLNRQQLDRVEAMINIDALGLSPTKISTARSNKDLVQSLIVMVYALKIPASQTDLAAAGTTDADPFAARHIPQITIHSLTQQNVATRTGTQFQPNNYYGTYRLLCGYLAYLDQSLKSRPHAE